MGLVEELEKLNDLKRRGAISEDEYEDAKAAILDSKSRGFKFDRTIKKVSSDEDMWGMFIHLSQFCGYIIPFAGLITPIILWQIKKKESCILDQHGRIVVKMFLQNIRQLGRASLQFRFSSNRRYHLSFIKEYQSSQTRSPWNSNQINATGICRHV